MKKILAFVLATAIIFLAFSSCNKVENDFELPVITDQVYTENINDKDGNLTCVIEYHYPAFDDKLPQQAQQEISNYFNQQKNDLVKSTKANVDNVSNYLTRFDLEGPEYTIIEFYPYFMDKFAVSFEIKKFVATNPSSVEPSVSAVTFSLQNGDRLTMKNLAKDNENYEDVVKKAIINVANTNYSNNGVALSQERIDSFNKFYNGKDFLYTGQGYSFVYDYALISEGTRTGTYYGHVKFENIQNFIMTPEEYNNSK